MLLPIEHISLAYREPSLAKELLHLVLDAFYRDFLFLTLAKLTEEVCKMLVVPATWLYAARLESLEYGSLNLLWVELLLCSISFYYIAHYIIYVIRLNYSFSFKQSMMLTPSMSMPFGTLGLRFR